MPNKKACDLRPTLFTKKNLKQKDARHAPFHDETMRNQKSSCLIISQQPVSVQTTLPQHLTDSRPLFHHKSCCLSKTAAQSSPIGFRPCIPSLISHAISDLVFAPYSHLLCLSDIFIQNTKRIKIQREYEVRDSFLHICQQFCRRKCHFLLQMRRNQTPDILF